MTAPRRIQLRRTKAWRKPPDAVTVSRGTSFGNPWRGGSPGLLRARLGRGRRSVMEPLDHDLTPAQVVAIYRAWIVDGEIGPLPSWLTAAGRDAVGMEFSLLRQRIWAAMTYLRGRDLCCWCPLDQPCHADVLLEFANR